MRFQGAPYCFVPEEDMDRVCQILVDKDSWVGVTCRCDWPQLLEVASELCNEFRWISGGGRCCQMFAWNTQWFAVDEHRHGRLRDFFTSRSHSEENEGKGFSPTLL